MNRRLITVFGGSGFIGRHVIRRLVADGWTVRAAVRDPVGASFLQPLGDAGQIVPVGADVVDPATVEAAVRDADAVINLVGILYERGRRTFRRIHVDGAANVARAAKAAGVERLVQMSAIGADADSPAAYGRTKKAGEEAAKAAFPGVTIVRPSVVFGPEDDFFNRFAKMAQFLPVLPVFETSFQPVYVGDVADAVIKIIDDPATAGNTYELGGPRVIGFRELMELVLSETRRRRLLLPIPLAVAEIEAWFLEKLPVPPLTRDQVKLLEHDNVVSAKARTFKDLGLEPTAVEAILPTYLHQYRPPVLVRRRSG
jgi:NADH dehydrogenase